MVDVLKTGSAWLEKQRVAFMTRTVSYRRGSDSVDLGATIGAGQFQVDRALEVHMDLESRDYLIATADLVIASVATLPQSGDQIVETDDAGKSFTYEVMAPFDGEPHFRYSDPERARLRVHTKLVGSSP